VWRSDKDKRSTYTLKITKTIQAVKHHIQQSQKTGKRPFAAVGDKREKGDRKKAGGKKQRR
jgi:hypothetical protein